MNRLIPLLASGLMISALHAKTITLKPTDDWFAVLNGDGLKPGDKVVLREGLYSDRRMLVLKHRGSEAKPIIIGAKTGEKVVFKRPDAKQNSFNLVGTQYLTLKDIEITGGSSGVRISADGDIQPKFITLEGLHIHHIGGVGVTCNHKGSIYEGMIFRRNHIHHTSGHGEAFYLGANNEKDGSTPGYIFNSLIEGNYIHDLNGVNISQGDGIEIKDGSYGNTICDNVIHDTNYPGILVYGTDGKAPNVIERNVIWNTKGNGLQAAAEAVIVNNIIFDAGNDAIHVRSHQSADPGKMLIAHNTIFQSKDGKTGLRIQRPDGGFNDTIVVANNAIYAPIALRTPKDDKLRLLGNAGDGSSDNKDLSDKEWMPGGKATKDLDDNFHPTPGSFLIGKGSYFIWTHKQNPRGYEFTSDFAKRPYPKNKKVEAGAYQVIKGRTAWVLHEGFKRLD